MVKRSREDFEPSSSDSDTAREPDSNVRLVTYPLATAQQSPASFKIIHLDTESGEAQRPPEMLCSLPPHRQTLSFITYEEYEVHYLQIHTNRCTQCRKNFPTEHYLNLHIEENHDSLISVRKERGEKIYSCFVEDCDRKCSTPQKRRMHLVDKHLFPKDYDFFVVNNGTDRRSSMLRSGKHRRKSSAAQQLSNTEQTRQRSSTLDDNTEMKDTKDGTGELPEHTPEGNQTLTPGSSLIDADMDGLTDAISALRFVPPSVRFGRGRGRGRGGFSRT